MATSGDIGVKPNHVIIWCDQNMAVDENNKASKAVLDENADLNRPVSSEYCPDIDNFICNINPYLNRKQLEDLVKSPLRMFISEKECIKCIHDSLEANKKPFVITSGQMGALVIPHIHKILSGSIYVFCAQRHVHESWTKNYEKDIEIYDDEKGVFGKVLLDIGIYYLTKGQKEPPKSTAAIQYLYWATRLFNCATRVDKIKRDDYLYCVQEELSDREAPPSDENDNDVQMGEDAN